MKKKLMTMAFAAFMTIAATAQQIPLGSCGIVYIYDAGGNRTKRIYFCNNGGTYPSFASTPASKAASDAIEVQLVDALYPNPTSGAVSITFSSPLHDAGISIVDPNNKLVQQTKASGQKITLDLSTLAAGTYFIRINDKERVIVKKVVKL